MERKEAGSPVSPAEGIALLLGAVIVGGISWLGPKFEPTNEAPCAPEGTGDLSLERARCIPDYVEDFIDWATPGDDSAPPEGEPAVTTTTTTTLPGN